MKNLFILLTFSLLTQITLSAQFDQEGVLEKKTSITKEVEVKDEDGILTVKILTKDGEGNEDVTVWSGAADDPDMPDDVKVIVEEGLKSETNNKQIRLKVKDENGEEKLLEWDGTGEMPAEMKQLMEENGHNMNYDSDNLNRDLKEKHEERRATRKIEYNPNVAPRGFENRYNGKAKIGIKITEENGVVSVVEPMPGTAASEAGVLANDIIIKLDDTDIDSLERLYAELATHNPGDKVKMVVNRNGKEKTMTLQLK